MVKVLQLSYSDLHGGAAKAAYRTHQALRSSGVDSRMLVSRAASDDPTVEGPRSLWGQAIGRLRPQLVKPLIRAFSTGNPVLHSPAVLPSRWPARLNASEADVVHLHWIQAEMLAIREFSRIRKPVVWTLHDMWAFCGAEHYAEDARWKDGYRRNNRPDHESGFDLNRWAWLRKCRHWKQPLSIVAPSHWLAQCVRSSALMRDWPVTVIPNPIDTNWWRPIERCRARDQFGLPQDVPLLLFGAMGGERDQRKGFDLLVSALRVLRRNESFKTLHLVVFGQSAKQGHGGLGFPVHYAGHLGDEHRLRALYSAADLMVIPSRQDNLPNTGVEAQACGIPVVAFDIGGLSDIVVHRQTGYLAQAFDPQDLAAGICWVLNAHQSAGLGSQSRRRAEELWSYSKVAALYQQVYQHLIR